MAQKVYGIKLVRTIYEPETRHQYEVLVDEKFFSTIRKAKMRMREIVLKQIHTSGYEVKDKSSIHFNLMKDVIKDNASYTYKRFYKIVTYKVD